MPWTRSTPTAGWGVVLADCRLGLCWLLRVAATEKAEAEKVVIVKQAEAEAESKFLQGQGTVE